jgi:hypothetical protein
MTTTARSSAFAISARHHCHRRGLAFGAVPLHAFPMVPLDPSPPLDRAKFSFGGAS